MPRPTDQKLYDESKRFIMERYHKNSPLASGAIVKDYKQKFKKKYGTSSSPYINDEKEKSLKRWFDEKWINVNPMIGILNDSSYPVFRPTNKVNEKTPSLFQDIPKKHLKNQVKLKQDYKEDHNLPTFIGGMIVRSFPEHNDNRDCSSLYPSP